MTFKKFCILIILFLSINSYSQITDTPEKVKDSAVIARIIIDGNERTKDKWFLTKTGFVEGELYDSLKLIRAEQILKESRLFSFSKIYPIINGNRATILITVREQRYFKITDYSGAMYSKKWGQESKRFLQAYGAFKLENFRGMEEELKLSLSFWTIRYLNLSWYKPFLKNPYFITIGSTVGSRPSINSPWNLDFYNMTYGRIGRRISNHSRISIGIDGRYKKQRVMSDGQQIIHYGKNEKKAFNKALDSINSDLGEVDDTTWTYAYASSDTADSSYYIWNGNHSGRVTHLEKPYTESFLYLRWSTDKRDNNYNPHKGFYSGAVIYSNFLWPYIDNFNGSKDRHNLDTSPNASTRFPKDTIVWSAEDRRSSTFVRFGLDLRFYHRGIWESNTVAYRIQPLITPIGKNNIYSGIYMGDIGNLRGYGSGHFGGYQYNNRFLFSLEYRFPLFKMPDLKFPFLSWYDKGMANLSTKFDGALIFDYGRIWANLENPFNDIIEPIDGMGLGLGIRVISPNVKRSLCFDVVWGIPAADESKPAAPWWALYIDLPF